MSCDGSSRFGSEDLFHVRTGDACHRICGRHGGYWGGAEPGANVEHPVAATTDIAGSRPAAPLCAWSSGGIVNRVWLFAWLAALVVLAFVGCSRLPVLPNTLRKAPSPVLRVTPAQGTVPFDAVADTSESSDPDGEIVLRELAIGDGPYQEIAAEHPLRFNHEGTYRVSLRVTDDSGETAVAETSVLAHPMSGSAQRFRIDVRYPSGRVAAREREAVEAAVAKWSEVVVGDLRDASVRSGQVEQSCGSDYRYSGPIDDLLLFGDVRDLDGPGGVVGMAGACLLRSDGFPLVGVIVLDRADVDFLAASGDLHTVVRHELGHVLDLSMSGWQRRGLLSHDRSGCYDSHSVHFTGEAAEREFARLGGAGRVPVENNGVMGTACSHWDEETFHSELMTGYLDRDAPLSRITGGALSDMGYQVDLDATDAYALSDEGELRTQGAGVAIGEQLIPVGGILDDEGELKLVPLADPVDLQLELPAR